MEQKQVIVLIILCICICCCIVSATSGAGYYYYKTKTITCSTSGPYSKDCLRKWFTDAGCTNTAYIDNYPAVATPGEVGDGWWHSQSPSVVQQDMKNWTTATDVRKSHCFK